MNPKQELLSVNFTPGRGGVKLTNIILHTMDGTLEGSQATFQRASSQVSAHYGVDQDGSQTQWVNDSDTAWHAGNWPVNLASIGIEHSDNAQPNAPRPDALYTGSSALVASLCRKWGIPCKLVNAVNGVPEGPGILIHKQVDQLPGGTDCPDGLDFHRIVSQAADLLGQQAAAANVTVNSAVEPATVMPANQTVTVIAPTLDVHNAPNDEDAGDFANTPDGKLHEGDEVHVIGYVIGQDPYNDGRNVWLKTLNILNESHWIWAGDTSFVPNHLAVVPVSPAAPAAPVDAVVPPAVNQVAPAQGTATIKHSGGIVMNLTTMQPVAKVKGGAVLPIAGTTEVDEVLYLVTKFMVEKGVNQGIAVNQFAPTTPQKIGFLRNFFKLHGL